MNDMEKQSLVSQVLAEQRNNALNQLTLCQVDLAAARSELAELKARVQPELPGIVTPPQAVNS